MTIRVAMLLLSVFLLAGCRQPDGTMPEPSGEQANKTHDISRDLMAMARAEQQASKDLAADLENLVGRQPPRALVQELATRVEGALKGKTLTDEAAQKLSRQLYIAIAATELSERQIGMLQKDVVGTLMATGATAPQAEPVGESVGEIQRLMGTNRRRWWHRQ
jgi:hypothetical protein